MKRTQLQTQTVRIPAGTVAGIYEIPPFEINPNYKKISGFKFVEIYNGDNFIHRVSFLDTADTFIDSVNTLFLKSNYASIINVDFTPCNIKAKGNKIIAYINITSNLVNDYKFDMIYELTDDSLETFPRIKYKTETITVPIASTFNEALLTMDLVYKKVTGIAMVNISNNDPVRLTISDPAGEFITNLYQDELIITHFDEASKRFLAVDLMATGNKVTVKTLPVTTPTGSQLIYDLVFKLEM